MWQRRTHKQSERQNKEITQLEQQEEKHIFKNEDILRDLWEYIKNTKSHTIGAPEKKKEREMV